MHIRPLLSTLQRKSHLCIPFLGMCGLSPNFHIHVSVGVLYITRNGPNISCSRIGRSIVGIYKSLKTHACGNWDCGRALPFLGIFVSNFRYCFFAVYTVPHGFCSCGKPSTQGSAPAQDRTRTIWPPGALQAAEDQGPHSSQATGTGTGTTSTSSSYVSYSESRQWNNSPPVLCIAVR
jgi:hypothetical protein